MDLKKIKLLIFYSTRYSVCKSDAKIAGNLHAHLIRRTKWGKGHLIRWTKWPWRFPAFFASLFQSRGLNKKSNKKVTFFFFSFSFLTPPSQYFLLPSKPWRFPAFFASLFQSRGSNKKSNKKIRISDLEKKLFFFLSFQ